MVAALMLVAAPVVHAAQAQPVPPATQPSPAVAEIPDVEVILANGDRLRGVLLSESEAELVVRHAVLGELVLPRTAVVSTDTLAPTPLEDEPGPDPVAPSVVEVPAPAKAPPPAKPKPDEKEGLVGSPILRGYNKSLNIGLTGTDGNTETISLFGRFEANQKNDKQRTDLRASYFFSRNSNGRTRNEGDIQANRDWLMPDSKLFAFGRVQYQYDEFEAWTHRASVFGGPGYTFYDSPKFRLVGRLGLGATYEFGDVDEIKPEGLAGIEGHWQTFERQKLVFKNTTFPLLDDLGEYRNVTEVSYVIDLERGDGLQVKFGIENEYESVTANNAAHNDVKYFAAVVFKF